MTTPPENIVAYEGALKKVIKENDGLHADSNSNDPNLASALKRTDKWDVEYKGKSLEELKEDTRNSLGCWIIRTFAISIGVFVICGCLIAGLSDEAHLKNFISVVQTIGALLTGAVGFVLGHYFTNKDSH